MVDYFFEWEKEEKRLIIDFLSIFVDGGILEDILLLLIGLV